MLFADQQDPRYTLLDTLQLVQTECFAAICKISMRGVCKDGLEEITVSGQLSNSTSCMRSIVQDESTVQAGDALWWCAWGGIGWCGEDWCGVVWGGVVWCGVG